MSESSDRLEWLYLRVALGLVALIAVAVVVSGNARYVAHPQSARLKTTIACLKERKNVVAVVPAGDPLADSAGDGSLKTTIEGNDVTVALASSQRQAAKIERYYNAVAGDLEGRLERREKTVYLWAFTSSPTQRQAMYDCQY